MNCIQYKMLWWTFHCLFHFAKYLLFLLEGAYWKCWCIFVSPVTPELQGDKNQICIFFFFMSKRIFYYYGLLFFKIANLDPFSYNNTGSKGVLYCFWIMNYCMHTVLPLLAVAVWVVYIYIYWYYST